MGIDTFTDKTKRYAQKAISFSSVAVTHSTGAGKLTTA